MTQDDIIKMARDYGNEVGSDISVLLEERMKHAFDAGAAAEREKLLVGDAKAQCLALNSIGSCWYDGKIRNQSIADTCFELKKKITEAIRIREQQ